jgi:hypothetical protein
MDAELDLLLTSVFVTADDLLPERQTNAAPRVTDAELVTLCVAQAIMGIPSDRRFLVVAGKRLGHLFSRLPKQPGYFKGRRRLADTLEWLMGVFASQSPGFYDDLLLIDSTPVECARSRETIKRAGDSHLDDALANAADYGWCASHSQHLGGFRLHALVSPDGTPRALGLCSAKVDEKAVALTLLQRARRRGGEVVIADKNYRGRQFTIRSSSSTPRSSDPADVTSAKPARTSRRSDNGSSRSSGPARTCSPSNATAPAPCKDSENASSQGSAPRRRYSVNHQLGLPSRALVNYTA